MSYRNQRRDSGYRDNRNSSGSYGGGGGSRRQSYGSGNQVNPWQGGVVPGGNQMGGLALLPTPAQTGLLSQLTTPEAQLAMATNLLNKILSPQQNQTSNVPSLLSLHTGPINRSMSYNDYRSRNSYADRRRERPVERRMQPYSKSGLNRRGDGKSRLGRSRNSDKSSSSPKPRKRDTDDKDKKNKDGEKANGDVSVEDDDSKRGEDGEKKTDKESEGDKEKDDKYVCGAKYAGVPNALLVCHVCHKNMWDATSFEKHVTGKRHQIMMEQLDETYKIKVELLRHEQRAAESQREMEIERLERQGKKVFNNKREYCTMCDLHFYGNLISHRKKDRHQKLKSFLHPKCHLCHKEFPNRLEWDDHKLTAPHLLKVAEYHRTTKPGVKDEDMDGNDIESLDGGDVSVFAELDDDLDFSKDGKKLDFDLSVIPASVEEYDPEAPVGTDLVVEVSGHLCKICNKFLNNSEEAQVHSRTLTHYKNFAAVVKLKAKAEKGKEAAEKAAEAKARKKENEKKKRDGKDDEGNWKRKKEGEKDNSADDESKDEKMDDEPVVKSEKIATKKEVKSEEEEEEEGEKMDVDAGAADKSADAKKEKYDPENPEEENEEKEAEPAPEEPEEEPKVEEETPTSPMLRARNRGGRGGSGGARGKARRGK